MDFWNQNIPWKLGNTLQIPYVAVPRFFLTFSWEQTLFVFWVDGVG